MTSTKQLAQRLFAAAAVIHFTLAQPLVLPRHFAAEAAAPRRKVSADGLLHQARQSLALTVAYSKRAGGIRGKAAGPFVKALRETDKALADLRQAASTKKGKPFAQALARANRAVGRFNGSYRLSGLRSRRVAEGVADFNKSWKAYFARAGGAKSAATPESTRENGRRIAALKNRVSDLRNRRSGDGRQQRELDRMIRALERAEAANRLAASQWLALALLDEVFGWYGGYYDYVVVTDPAYASEFRDVYVYWNDVSTFYEVSYETYYESYSFVSYEESYTVSEEYSVSFTAQEETLITTEEARIEISFETLYEESEASAALTTEVTALAQADEATDAAAVEDPAETANPEVDDQVLDQSAPALDPDEALASVPAGAAEATDDAGPGDTQEDAAPDEADPDQQEDAASDADQSGDGGQEDAAPGEDEGGPDEPEEAAPDTNGSDESAEPDDGGEDAAPGEDEAQPDEPAPDEPEEAAPEADEPAEAGPEDDQSDEGVQEDAGPAEEDAEPEEAAPEEAVEEDVQEQAEPEEAPVEDVQEEAPAEEVQEEDGSGADEQPEEAAVEEAPADDGGYVDAGGDEAGGYDGGE